MKSVFLVSVRRERPSSSGRERSFRHAASSSTPVPTSCPRAPDRLPAVHQGYKLSGGCERNRVIIGDFVPFLHFDSASTTCLSDISSMMTLPPLCMHPLSLLLHHPPPSRRRIIVVPVARSDIMMICSATQYPGTLESLVSRLDSYLSIIRYVLIM